MSYVANTRADRQRMLEMIGVRSTSDLFVDIPARVRNPKLNLPPPLTEPEALRHLRELSERNYDLLHYPCFLGAGVYRHFIPSAVGYVTSRAEFSTSYTPYQPEVSQGNLQAIYEYQSLVCLLTGMDVANASMYDGATAIAEAAIMAVNVTGRRRVLLSPAVHPEYRAVVGSYLMGQEVRIDSAILGSLDGGPEPTFDPTEAERLVDEETACIVVQQPNFFGCIENVPALAGVAHRAGALLVVCVDPISLGILQPPGCQGADVVVGEGQPLGLAPSFGGPYLGLFACREGYVRQMPGRLVGATVDARGDRGFVLTFQTREQHIRREKATSNICSNEALCALAAAVYLNWMGSQGLRQVAETCLQRAHYAARRIAEIPGFEPAFATPFFDEFAVRCPVAPAEVNRRLLTEGIIGGYEVGRVSPRLDSLLLLCVTEMNPREEIDRLVEVLARISAERGDGRRASPPGPLSASGEGGTGDEVGPEPGKGGRA